MQILIERLSKELRTKDGSTRYALWGTGELGTRFLHHIQNTFPKFSCLGITSSSFSTQCPESIDGIVCKPPKEIIELRPDALIVASVRFEKEIVLQVNRLLADKEETIEVFYPSRALEEMEFRLANSPEQFTKHQLEALIYQFPESEQLWRTLSTFCSDKEKAILRKCADLLTSTIS